MTDVSPCPPILPQIHFHRFTLVKKIYDSALSHHKHRICTLARRRIPTRSKVKKYMQSQSLETMFRSLFIFNEQYSKLICKGCRYAITSTNVQKHLWLNHKHVPLQLRLKIIQHAKRLPIVNTSTVPELCHTPIVGLQLDPGYTCVECQLICKEVSTMQHHARNTNRNDPPP